VERRAAHQPGPRCKAWRASGVTRVASRRSTAAFWWGPPAQVWSPSTPGRASRTAHTWPIRL